MQERKNERQTDGQMEMKSGNENEPSKAREERTQKNTKERAK